MERESLRGNFNPVWDKIWGFYGKIGELHKKSEACKNLESEIEFESSRVRKFGKFHQKRECGKRKKEEDGKKSKKFFFKGYSVKIGYWLWKVWKKLWILIWLDSYVLLLSLENGDAPHRTANNDLQKAWR